MLFVRIKNEDQVRQAAHVTNTVQRAHQFRVVARHHQRFFLGQLREVVGLHRGLNVTHALDRLGNGFPVCQHAARPAVVDVVLTTALCCFRNLLRRGALGANEENTTAFRNCRRYRFESAVKQWTGLIEIDDVNTVARAKEERSHLRVPAAGVVTKVYASFHELTQREHRRCHRLFSFRFKPPREPVSGIFASTGNVHVCVMSVVYPKQAIKAIAHNVTRSCATIHPALA